MSNFVVTASEGRGRAVSGSIDWIMVSLRRVTVSNFVTAAVPFTLVLLPRFGSQAMGARGFLRAGDGIGTKP